MKVFISWSGERSKLIAAALNMWLKQVIQALDPWMSDSDIEKGDRWSSDIADQLGEAKVGIICLTPENLNEPWILFEAGALSKTVEKTFVCPYLFEVEPTDVKWPLAQFQATKVQKEETKKLIYTLNRALEKEALPEHQLNEAFEMWWPKLEKQLNEIPKRPEIKSKRQEKDLLEEILSSVRHLINKQDQDIELGLIGLIQSGFMEIDTANSISHHNDCGDTWNSNKWSDDIHLRRNLWTGLPQKYKLLNHYMQQKLWQKYTDKDKKNKQNDEKDKKEEN
jgi:hypothetical protein